MATLNETLTSLADAIRDKSGTTDPMTLAGMITAVQGIETGGGLPTGIRKLDYGSFNVASDQRVYGYNVSHSLGEIPDFAILYSDTLTNPTGESYPIVLMQGITGGSVNSSGTRYSNAFSYGRYKSKDAFFRGLIKANDYLFDSTLCFYGKLYYVDDTESFKDGYYFRNFKYSWIAGCYV